MVHICRPRACTAETVLNVQTNDSTTCETFFLKSNTLTAGSTAVVANKRSGILSVSSLKGCDAGTGATCFISAVDNTGNCKQVRKSLRAVAEFEFTLCCNENRLKIKVQILVPRQQTIQIH